MNDYITSIDKKRFIKNKTPSLFSRKIIFENNEIEPKLISIAHEKKDLDSDHRKRIALRNSVVLFQVSESNSRQFFKSVKSVNTEINENLFLLRKKSKSFKLFNAMNNLIEKFTKPIRNTNFKLIGKSISNIRKSEKSHYFKPRLISEMPNYLNKEILNPIEINNIKLAPKIISLKQIIKNQIAKRNKYLFSKSLRKPIPEFNKNSEAKNYQNFDAKNELFQFESQKQYCSGTSSVQNIQRNEFKYQTVKGRSSLVDFKIKNYPQFSVVVNKRKKIPFSGKSKV